MVKLSKKRGRGVAKKIAANGATLGYEAQLRQLADALRGRIDAAEYKRVVHYLTHGGVAGFVLANGVLSSNQSREGELAHRTARVAGLSYAAPHSRAV